MWRDTLRGWRAFALVYFILIAVLTGAEVTGNLFAFADVPAFARESGITPELEAQRLISLSILSTGIAISCAAAAYGVWRGTGWAVRAGTVAGIILLLYMVYQILSAWVILTQNNYAILGAGSTYGLFGLIAMVLVRWGMREVK